MFIWFCQRWFKIECERPTPAHKPNLAIALMLALILLLPDARTRSMEVVLQHSSISEWAVMNIELELLMTCACVGHLKLAIHCMCTFQAFVQDDSCMRGSFVNCRVMFEYFVACAVRPRAPLQLSFLYVPCMSPIL
jgi:hypothetical protein